MLKPEQVTTEEYAQYALDERKTGVVFSSGLGAAAIAASQLEMPHEASTSLAVAGGALLIVAYNCGKQAVAYYRRLVEITQEEA